ncbi:PAAR domain-containing protein [Nitrincola sp. A-D6]|uniref:PAAR domain-containing protein n=1 Tax=Nitrincola sp. A-D6 TaxID=1545442 RepID=UPI0005640170|nr:PAAR domain-containing protein [Nitrincola sp. A-D6]
MLPIARVGDAHVCPKKGHGRGTIVSGGSGIVEGKAVARVGDKISCGCVIVEGAINSLDDGKAIAILDVKHRAVGKSFQVLRKARYNHDVL